MKKRTKEAAMKILLNKGWTIEEALEVLVADHPVAQPFVWPHPFDASAEPPKTTTTNAGIKVWTTGPASSGVVAMWDPDSQWHYTSEPYE